MKKSDQGGIEIANSTKKIYLRIRRNQTKVGLKFLHRESMMMHLKWRNQTKVGLKSINVETGGNKRSKMKKSDQGGIEIEIDRIRERFGMKEEEIRPRWDWNYVISGYNLFMKFGEEIRPRWDWNQSGSLLRWWRGTEEIRPRWDWNYEHRRELRDGHREEIRPRWDWNILTANRHGLYITEEEIRPRWDWNISPP